MRVLLRLRIATHDQDPVAKSKDELQQPIITATANKIDSEGLLANDDDTPLTAEEK